MTYAGRVITDEHPYVALAREAIRAYLATGEIPEPPGGAGDPPATGVFVSLHETPSPGAEDGALRGCVGTIVPREPTLRREIARSAVSAAVGDPRFPPLDPDEVDGLSITVYLLGDPEEVAGVGALHPERYGVIVEGSGGRRGLLLPGIPGISTAELQVDIARRKAGIDPDEPVRLLRFSARVIH